ncbi:M6 metalloprotease [Eremomyces bilateralis CBS 781.70]|uniref:M6 metalloprotease n=1 Tax=Eremomyces bilateralis CBS 781.70 TaxID=1392243 RepID=A0A6G1FX43_9PEZI|nr:M6 metalloprotease [Eremomyces bilateralis CBS 781.70]KAF1810261.1 M6 metalloprotease [Eremomyces bilateralis CBS 781.70]
MYSSTPDRLGPRQATHACKLPAKRGAYLTEGFSSTSTFIKTIGVTKAAVIFIDFPDTPATDTVQSLYDNLLPGGAQFFNISSYGQMQLEAVSDMKFHRMPQASTGYRWDRETFSGTSQLRYIKDAIAAAGGGTPYTGCEVLYIIPTRAARSIGFSPTSMGAATLGDGTQVKSVVTFGQDQWSWGYGVLNHETGHTMGLPDLYPMDSAGRPTEYYVGGWDLMGLISGTSPDFFAWHKWKLGWIEDDQVACIGTKGTSSFTISPIERAEGIKAVAVRVSDTKAIVMEVRSKEGLSTDSCTVGLLLYSVDTEAESGTGPVRVLNTKPSSRGCSPSKGGELTSAAYDFAKAETKIGVAANGISVQITGVQNGEYRVSVTWQ